MGRPAKLILLKDAPWTFASKRLREAYNFLPDTWRTRSAPVLASLLRKLREGKLEAWGVETSPERKRELEVLPSHLFVDAKIDWDRNKVTNFGVTYGAVQVRRRSIARVSGHNAETGKAIADTPVGIPVKAEDQPPSDAPRRKPGPPCAQEEAVAVFDRMLQKGVVKEGMTVKAIYKKLLPELKRNSAVFPNGRGLSYSSIARHLRPRLTGRLKFSS
jgi:hypothetical protein